MNILNEGFSGHIKHLYDNRELTFKKIKEIFTAAANGNLEGTEKVDGVNLLISFSVNEGRAKGARNKSDIKAGGVTGKDLYKRYKDNDNESLKEAFLEGLQTFEKIIQGLDHNTQIKLFGPDTNIYYNADIISPAKHEDEELNIINYDTKNLIIHDSGHAEYDKLSGDKKDVDISENIEMLKGIIKEYQEFLKHENFGIQINAIKKLKGLSNKTPLNISVNKLNSIISSTNNLIKNQNLKLNDDSTINDFMIARIYILLNSILEKAPEGFEKINPIAKTNIAKRLFGIKGISINDIRRNLTPEQFLYVKQNILNNEKNILKTAIQPLEILITNFTIEMLKNLNSAFILDDNKEKERIKDKLKIAIDEIEKIGNEKDLQLLKRQILKIKNIDSISTAAEGFVFDYDGVTYKFTGSFAPVNQILNLFKKIKKENDSGVKGLQEEDANRMADIALLAGSFKPPHKGHLDMVKQFCDMANKVYIFISPLSRPLPESGKEVTFEHSKQIFDLYLNQFGLNGKVEIFKSDINSPINLCFDFIENKDNNPNFAQPGQTIILGYSNKDSNTKITQEEANKKAKEGVKVIVKQVENTDNLNAKDMRSAVDSQDKKEIKNVYIPDVFGAEKSEIANKIIDLLINDKTLKESKSYNIINKEIEEHIVKKGEKYCLVSKKTHKNLGCYRSRKGAEKREKQVQYFKHLEEDGAAAGSAMGMGSVAGGAVSYKHKLEQDNE
jgi:hypothetical protein